MRDVAMVLIIQVPSATCALFAGKLCYDGKDGWGWFILAAIILAIKNYPLRGGK